jgi:hypothetical protein
MKDYDKIGWKAEVSNTISNCITAFCLGIFVCAIL